jgi:glycosyltransferase involved in cell wall biosynthesis
MSAPELSVVIASVNGLPYLRRCLESLEERCPQAEVIVADWTDSETRREVRDRWPAVRLLSFDKPMAVPELRAAGIAAARAPYVAVIEDHCVVRDGWAGRILAAHRGGHAVVGGPIRNGATARLRDWAAFFCEYSEFMEPVAPGPTEALVGMNVSYDRDAIDAMGELLGEGRWETWLHPHLRRRGFELYSDPAITLDHVKDFGVREFISQRYHYARSHAGMRNPELRWKRVVYVLGSPLIVPLMYLRIARAVFRKRRHRRELLLATPLVLLYLAVWAWGEAVGNALGGGRSLLRVR